MTGPSEGDPAAPQLVRSELVYEGRPFNVTRETFRLDNGDEVQRSIARHPGAVALVAVDGDGRWLLVRQYRIAAERVLLELPAGTREPGEAPETTAARELREETGYAAERLERLGGAFMAPGFCTEYIHYYLATGLRLDPLPKDIDEEFGAPARLSLEELGEAAARGEIEDAKTLVAMTLMRGRAHRE